MNVKHLMFKLGSQPKKSLRFFLIGIGLFLVSMSLIALGYVYSHYFQIAGLVILPFAFVTAIYGYIGIFANRLSQFLDQSNRK